MIRGLYNCRCGHDSIFPPPMVPLPTLSMPGLRLMFQRSGVQSSGFGVVYGMLS
jgi:hypothetical protein